MYLVTGASGFIGKHLLDALTKRGQKIHCLFYPPAVADFRDLIDQRWPSSREQFVIVPMTAGMEESQRANVDGTRNACRLAEAPNTELY
jgi:nucleoside-diphosphate-sugar epimerase